MSRYGIVVDVARCTGCMTCVIACKEENLTRPALWWNKVFELESESQESIIYIRHACMHCKNPACAEACPSDAIYKRPDGVVLIDQKKCTGARDCVDACPYGAMGISPAENYFPGKKIPYEEKPAAHRRHKPGNASKCTLCAHRIEQGKQPICVEGCPSKAMVFGNLDKLTSPIQEKLIKATQLLSEEGTGPQVTYIVPGNTKKQIEKRVEENPNMIP